MSFVQFSWQWSVTWMWFEQNMYISIAAKNKNFYFWDKSTQIITYRGTVTLQSVINRDLKLKRLRNTVLRKMDQG